MPSKQKGTRVQFRLGTLLWGTMWFALLLAICIRQQHAATRQREVLESMRARGAFLLPPAATAGNTNAAAPTSVQPAAPASK